MALNFVSADEAALFVNHNDNVGFSGFTPAGCPKAVPEAIARRAEVEHIYGRPFKIGMFTGASTGPRLDGALAAANAIKFRTPYQSNKDLRAAINKGDVPYFDKHLSTLAQELRYGFLGKVDVAIIEAADVTEDGEIVPTIGVGISPTICRLADKIIVELNSFHPKAIRGLHDIMEPEDPPYRKPFDVANVDDRIGQDHIKVDPKKIVAVVKTMYPIDRAKFTPLDNVTKAIGKNVAGFLAKELKEGRIPEGFLPIQSGVGNVANAVLAAVGDDPNIPDFDVYTEVIQDSVIYLMQKGHVRFASGCSLTVSPPTIEAIYKNLDFFKERLLLRPQEISNNPEIVRRLGVITINTALEVDICGNVNSTHVNGTKMMNGIGGSADFSRSGYISIFTTPSVAKDGRISAIVPMVSHLDSSEHSVQIIVTEYGVADLRGKSPVQRAEEIINNCAHPDYRDLLRQYMNLRPGGHIPQCLEVAFEFHHEVQRSGDMRNVDWEKCMDKNIEGCYKSEENSYLWSGAKPE